uniref:Uncharacterized protein n=1 Tax=virus sp. ctviY17 TaxID=2825828 RepID=A0A8S5RML6_9VIRU|nr:MAG TPA: hypothetical protein [virus sp. ctviY17]
MIGNRYLSLQYIMATDLQNLIDVRRFIAARNVAVRKDM